MRQSAIDRRENKTNELETHHPPGSKVGTLLALLALSQEAVQRPDSVGDQIVRLQEIEIL